MAGTSLTIPIDRLPGYLDTAIAELNDPGPLLNAVGFQLQELTVRRFHEGTDPYGDSWDEPKSITKASRMGKKGGERALQDRGILANSISYRPEGNRVRVGSDREYARIHQKGGTIHAKDAEHLHIPLNEEARREGPRRLYRRGMFKIRKGGGGTAVIEDESGELVPMFRLAKKVTIPQRSFLPDKQRGLPREYEALLKDIMVKFARGEL